MKESHKTNEGFEEGKVILISQDFFKEPGFLKRFDNEMKIFRTAIVYKKEDRESIKGKINAFMLACLNIIKQEDTRLYMHLEFFRTLIYYAEAYSSSETFENIINGIERRELKDILFAKQPARANMVYGETLLKYYSLENQKSQGWYTDKNFELIRKAKFYLLKVYTQVINGKNKLNESEFSYCLIMLSACFMHLSRWFEPLYYFKHQRIHKDDPNLDYLTAINLNAFKDKTCLNLEGQLLYRIFESSKKAIESPITVEEQKGDAQRINDKCLKEIEKAGLTVKKLQKHSEEISRQSPRRNPYFSYCERSQLFLNEHSFYCTCARSIGDTLKIKTQHLHTQMAWVQPFEKLLSIMISDFAMARQNFYQSELKPRPTSYYKLETSGPDSLQQRRDAHLKNSFSACYRILDQICYGIFTGLGIDIEKDKSEKVYFLNMWDTLSLTEKDFKENLYLISLKSIAKDLDRGDFSALSSFKKIRNSLEHKILFIADVVSKENSGLVGSTSISRADLISKTQLLMILTKSAILSFVYFIRRESKRKEMQSNAKVAPTEAGG